MRCLAIVLGTAALLGVVMRLLRQPIILAYLATGVILSAFGVYSIESQSTFSLFSDLGIMFLLFLVGLEINYTSIKMVGKTSVIIGLGQIAITFFIGFLIALLFHFSYVQSAYIAIALTFSSTIIVVKLLSEKKEINSLYGKISIGFLLVQDFVAILLLVVLTGLEAGDTLAIIPITAAIAKGIGLFAIMLWLGRRWIPKLFDLIGRSQELLFIVSLAWVFAIAAIAGKIGFSIEIAGFLAGIGLANSYENYQIASHVRPLRDFFILLFFVMLGSSVVTFSFAGLGLPILVFSLFVLIGNPLIGLGLMGLMGYRRRTSFLTGVTMAQISEFSLILVALGLKLGHINSSVVGLITSVGVITIVLSTYLIIHGEHVVKKLWNVLSYFERSRGIREDELVGDHFDKPLILVGVSRIGRIIASHLPKEELLLIDFDPTIIQRFRKHGYTCMLGDIADREIFEKANFEKTRLVVCTSPLFEDNMTLLTQLRSMPGKRKIILRADNDKESAILYRKGADYVIRPHLTSGHYIGEVLAQGKIHSNALWRAREKDYKMTAKEI